MAAVATTARSQILGGLPLAGPGSEFFTIAVISDTQNYVDGTQPQPSNESFFLDQTSYLAEKKHDLNLIWSDLSTPAHLWGCFCCCCFCRFRRQGQQQSGQFWATIDQSDIRVSKSHNHDPSGAASD
jgi:hypothetical protein